MPMQPRKPDQPTIDDVFGNPRPAADEQTSRQPTIADVLTDEGFERVDVSARWSSAQRAIVIRVRAHRTMTSEEIYRLRALARERGNDPAIEVFEAFEATLDQPLTFISETAIEAADIDVYLSPESIRRA